MSRTVYIRQRPDNGNYKVVVKPHPGTLGTNALELETHDDALEHAGKLTAAFGWPVVDESE